MKLTEEQKNEFLRKYHTIAMCPVCHGKSFVMTDDIYQLTEFNGTTMNFGSGVGLFPVVAIICNTCGHTSLVNPIIAGMLKKEDVS
jgi:hypothetical protein